MAGLGHLLPPASGLTACWPRGTFRGGRNIMTETTLTTINCRARTTFPWHGMLRDSVTFADEHGSYAAGTLVAVTGYTEGGFSVRVGRVQDPASEPAVTGS